MHLGRPTRLVTPIVFLLLTLATLPAAAQRGQVLLGRAETPLERLDRLHTSSFSIPNASGSIRLEFREKDIVATELEGGGSLEWFAVQRERVNKVSTRVRVVQGRGTDDDLDGSLTLRSEIPIPSGSVYLLTDEGYREFTVASPRALKLSTVTPEELQLEEGGDFLVVPGRKIHVLWFRIGEGLWHQRFQDGSFEDQDKEGNGQIVVSLADLKGQEEREEPPPENVALGDYFVLLDERSLQLAIVEVK